MDTKKLDKIIELNKKDLSLREIGVLVDMSPEWVRNTIKKYGTKKVGKNNKTNK